MANLTPVQASSFFMGETRGEKLQNIMEIGVCPSIFPCITLIKYASTGCSARRADASMSPSIMAPSTKASFLEGIQDMERAVALLVEAGPDAIQLNFGQADLLQNLPGREKPALVMRTDTGNPYNPTRHKVMFDILACDVDPVLPAVKLDAACVVCNLLFLSDDPTCTGKP